MFVHVRGMKNEKKRSKQGQTNNKAKQHSTPKHVHVCALCALVAAGTYVHVYTLYILYVKHSYSGGRRGVYKWRSDQDLLIRIHVYLHVHIQICTHLP